MHIRHYMTKISLFLLTASIFMSACGIGQPGISTSAPSSLTSSIQPTASSVGMEAISDIELPAAITLATGHQQSLTVIGSTRNNKKLNIAKLSGIEYRSSNTTIFAVSGEGVLQASESAVTGDSATLTVSIGSITQTAQVTIKTPLADSLAASVDGISVVANPADRAVVVNKQRALPSTYIPKDLIYPNVSFSFKEKAERRMMRIEAAKALEQLFDGAAKDGIKLVGISAYRSYATQKAVFQGNVNAQGLEEASRYSAKPGTSEHQTGLAIDVSSASANYTLEEMFGDTKEGKWLAQHAAAYGFIIRYPKRKESLTGYAFEPWHIRYVGVPIAQEVVKQNIAFEQYFQDAVPVQAGK
jgi:D-alanyl-D-alanine carboxypeptidase